jgi:hypothetical protein
MWLIGTLYEVAPAHSSYWTKQYICLRHLIMEEIHIVLSDNALHSEWRYWWLYICTVYLVNVTMLRTLWKWSLHVLYIYRYIYIYPYWVTVQNTCLHMYRLDIPKSRTNIKDWYLSLFEIWIVIFRVMSTHIPKIVTNISTARSSEKIFWT